MPGLHHEAVCLDHLVAISRAQCDQARYRTQRYELLNRVVRGTILTIAHGVMRENKITGQFHEGGQTNRRTRVIAEYEEPRAKRSQLGKREPVDDCRHRVHANVEVEDFSVRIAGLEISCPWIGKEGFVGRAEVG